jgi:NADP-dependent 3-hydroxy acid dehydrogenase YdfG
MSSESNSPDPVFPTEALQHDDIARAVIYAVSQSPHVNVNEILVRPTAQQG